MPRYLTLVLLFCGITQIASAQTAEADLKFDQRFTKCERKWVVVPKKPADTRYAYGYIYMDMQAGFTFDLKGFITIDGDKFVADTSMTKTGFMKYRLGPNWPMVALLPEKHFKEMNIHPDPWWIKSYYSPYTDTVAHNFREGFNYNAAGDCATALTFLNQVYKVNPAYPGLIFELSYAYNALNQPDDAIKLLKEANKKDPNDIMLYRELGYAYMKKDDKDKAIDYFKQGIAHSKDGPGEQKGEMAYNMASIYKKANDTDNYKAWMQKAKEWSAPTSQVYKAAVSQGF